MASSVCNFSANAVIFGENNSQTSHAASTCSYKKNSNQVALIAIFVPPALRQA
jgi:hypothetical protein